MKKLYILSLLFLVVIFLGVNNQQVMANTKPSAIVDKALGTEISEEKLDAMYQVSTYDAYKNGFYKTGENTVVTQRKYGDFGIGLMKDESGAFIYDTKNAYKAKDFKLLQLANNEYIPVAYGIFKYFDTDDRISVKNAANITEFTQQLDKKLDTLNYFVAIKAKGKFNSIVLQTETNEKQTFSNVKGEIIGFRIPEFYSKTAPSGYSLYFISDDKTIGAKVYEANIDIVACCVDYSNRMDLILPKNKSFKVKDFSIYQPQTKDKTTAKKNNSQKDMQQIMNSSRTNEPAPEELMQMIAPKMTF